MKSLRLHSSNYFSIACLFLLSVMSLQSSADVGQVSGTVTDARTGRPLDSASVRLETDSGIELDTLVTDESGHFQSGTVEEGLVRIMVSRTAYRDAEERAFRVVSGKVNIIDFALQAMPAVLEEIIVSARPRNSSPYAAVSSTWLDREEIRRAPGTAGDIFRGLKTLPGVTATGEFSNFSVRGRGPRDNLILIDGIPYDRLVHFDASLGEQEDLEGGGRFSIFGQNVVGAAEFRPGGWESAYGGANGSLLKLHLADGNEETAFTSLKLDLAGGELLYDGPSKAFTNTSVLLSLRHYNFGWLFDLIGEEDIGTPRLSDFIFKSVTRLNERTTLKLLALYTPESYKRTATNVLASENFKDTTIASNSQDAGLLGVTLENLVGATGRLSNILYVRRADDNSRQGEAFPERSPEPVAVDNLVIEDDILQLDENETEAGWRMDYQQLNHWGEFHGGVRLSLLDMDYSRTVARDYPLFIYDQNDYRPAPDQNYVLLTPGQYNSALNENTFRAAIYADQVFNLGPFSLRPGIRLDNDSLLDDFSVSPRIQANWQYNADTRLSATAGIYYQHPRLLDIAANSANRNLKPEQTTQFSVGLEHYFSEDYKMMLEAYYQILDDLVTEGDRVSGSLNNNGGGRTTGVDWLLSRQLRANWSATLRYSYVRARRDDNNGNGTYPAEFSRPHLGSITVNYEPNDRWMLSAQYQIASGRPSDSYIIHADVLGAAGPLRYSREITQRNNGRYPSFQTLNLRLDYRRNFRALNIIAFIDVINVLGRTNIDDVEFSPRTGTIDNEGLDTFPQLGFTLEF